MSVCFLFFLVRFISSIPYLSCKIKIKILIFKSVFFFQIYFILFLPFINNYHQICDDRIFFYNRTDFLTLLIAICYLKLIYIMLGYKNVLSSADLEVHLVQLNHCDGVYSNY